MNKLVLALSLKETLWSILEPFYNAIVPEQRYKAYLSGLGVTLIISLFAVLLGVIIGGTVAIIRVGSQKSSSTLLKILDKVCRVYVTIFRATPVIVQLMIIYNLVFTARNTSGVLVGIICFGINSGAYVSEIIRAGILSVDGGQREAGRSLGFGEGQTMWYIILPQAIKNILPALGNEFIVLVKETSVASVIAVNELMKMASYIGSRTFDVLPPLLIVAAMYLVIVLILTKILSWFERRLAQSDTH